ncbi:glycosyltransferase family 2 protein [Pediococcus claussenii]|uniref:Glycosyl transferase 2 family protein n=1 Tax=Pediococcus claussenii (strain ATCC BAA-344 / DSM 14800 / JCM 18046 / KCTC 3811 / LMG 21948 / P06) TaxID=701521 RepID=G8PBJ0_PEDCP|nr:glycosyltransferase family 2 protein [Pediococcus claussenii]AEV94739.1 glycosyl transferase 2 family protein [Pediococcus claussenii ATCC BAA-344]ANZ69935.1 ribonuclease III [Pediococcus claussenii]ANZ71751.1 ribonuclease III [Pediococcus claussenii]KRN20918.1 hypothetical protein IV79_GL000143 [Pediococcus claussenii]
MEKLTVVVPAFNEEEVLHDSIKRLNDIEAELINDLSIDYLSDILIVDDGSTDKTWHIIEEEHRNNPRIKGIKFSRNFGHQNALLAGMRQAIETADIVVTIDADLQDDPNAIKKMVELHQKGNQIVYGVRNNRDTDTWFKRNSAQLFYKLLNMIGVQLIINHADFRLMAKPAVEALLEYKERNLFLRGVIPMLGFESERVYYKRTARTAGTSKYPLKKMLSFAWEGITSLTIAPVRLILYLGALVSLFGIGMFIYTVVEKLSGSTVHGWSSLMISIWILGGFQMMSLGIVGEYIGKVTTEVKRRPRYTVEKVLR